jgi:replicative DNA helicase
MYYLCSPKNSKLMAEPRNTKRASVARTPLPVKQVDEYGHLQPQAPELEEAVIGALMIEKDAYSLVSEILKPASFYEHRHQLIYQAITDLSLRQQPVDILTVTEQLRTMGVLDEVGGPFYITQLSGKMVSSPRSTWRASSSPSPATSRRRPSTRRRTWTT